VYRRRRYTGLSTATSLLENACYYQATKWLKSASAHQSQMAGQIVNSYSRDIDVIERTVFLQASTATATWL
jgi:hypothetical protein